MNDRITLVSIVTGALLLGTAAVGTAEELRQQLNPSMILNMLARPVETPQAAFNAGLRSDPGPSRSERADGGEVLPDGSVRYGHGSTSLTVIVRNPCPPGDIAHESAYLRSLPGRGRR
jgi:hypothetical protein